MLIASYVRSGIQTPATTKKNYVDLIKYKGFSKILFIETYFVKIKESLKNKFYINWMVFFFKYIIK